MKEFYFIQILCAAFSLVNVTPFGHTNVGTYNHGAVSRYGNGHGIYGTTQERFPSRTYTFNYAAPDSSNFHYRREQKHNNGNVEGSYGYSNLQGLYRHVDYMANSAGFKANVRTNEPGITNKRNPAEVFIHAQGSPPGLQENYTPSSGNRFRNHGSSLIQPIKEHEKSRVNHHHGNRGDANNIRGAAHAKGEQVDCRGIRARGGAYVKGLEFDCRNTTTRPPIIKVTPTPPTNGGKPDCHFKRRGEKGWEYDCSSPTTRPPIIKVTPTTNGGKPDCHFSRRGGKGLEFNCRTTTSAPYPKINGVLDRSSGISLYGIGGRSHINSGGYIRSVKKGDIGDNKLYNSFSEIQRNFNIEIGY